MPVSERCQTMYERSQALAQNSKYPPVKRLYWPTFLWNQIPPEEGCKGSQAAITIPGRLISASGQKAATHQAKISAPLIAAIGQLRSFEQTNTCSEYAGSIKLIASIEDPAVIKKILAHLDGKAPPAATALLPECRGPPQAKLFKGL